jgi:dTDP-4-amino-4,6-dideoxy-D-galactose acyltransferase
MSYRRLEWDSRFFGFPVGRVEAEDGVGIGTAVRDADADAVRCLYFLCPAAASELVAAALGLGFGLFDVRIELECRPLSAAEPAAAVRDAVPSDREALERIARERLRGTRFWNDPRFDRERVADLYSEWLLRGLASPSRRTLVAGDCDGFITCGLDPDGDAGEIELIAVAAGADGRGVGGSLVAAATSQFAAAGFERATVVTQAANVGAQRLYQRCGYRTRRVDLWLHRWAD